MQYAGELAALTTAVCWTVSALCFSLAGARIGSLAVNIVRLVMALVMFAVWGLAVRGEAIPLSATREAWFWLSLSGVAGFFIGDLCLFRAFVLIGPRLGLLIMSLAPPITALMGWLALGERMNPAGLLGMAVTLAGVAWVITESPVRDGSNVPHRFTWKGGLLALVGSIGQAAGVVLAKPGLEGAGSPFAATTIRLVAGLACFAAFAGAVGWYPRILAGLRDGRAMGVLALGAFAGPFAGVTLMMFAIGRISTGLAQTFVATTPVLVIPFSILFYRELVSGRALAGAALTVVGVALLFIR